MTCIMHAIAYGHAVPCVKRIRLLQEVAKTLHAVRFDCPDTLPPYAPLPDSFGHGLQRTPSVTRLFFAFDCMGAYSAMHGRVLFCAFSTPPFGEQDYGVIKFQGAANTAIETMVDVLLRGRSWNMTRRARGGHWWKIEKLYLCECYLGESVASASALAICWSEYCLLDYADVPGLNVFKR